MPDQAFGLRLRLIGGVKSAAFPVGIALGATWNVELVGEIGAALAGQVQGRAYVAGAVSTLPYS